jgi:hypothetical protein
MSIEGPFVGLSPFDEKHRKYFFGRSADASIVAANILASKLLVAFGRSGVGKSSLFLAGVKSALDEFEETIYICLREWRSDPYETVKAALSAYAVDAEQAQGADADVVTTMAFGIVTRLRRPLILVLDQFEEYFQYPDEAARAKFEAALSRIVYDNQYDVHFVLSLRDDAVYRLDRFRMRIPEIMARTIEIEGLGTEGAIEAIRRPILTFNAEHGTSYRVADAFVSTLIEQVRTERLTRARSSGGENIRKDGVEAPFLQLALTTLWDEMQRRHETELSLTLLQNLGGAREIVGKHFDAVIHSVKRQQRYLATIFDRLITSEGHKIAMSADELSTIVKGSLSEQTLLPRRAIATEVREVLDKLSTGSHRILRVTEDGRYELFHDVLAKRAIEWVRSFEQKRRDQRRHRLYLYLSAAAVLAIVIVSAVWVEHGNRRSLIARELARAAVAEITAKNPEGAVLAAAKVLELLPDEADARGKRRAWSARRFGPDCRAYAAASSCRSRTPAKKYRSPERNRRENGRQGSRRGGTTTGSTVSISVRMERGSSPAAETGLLESGTSRRNNACVNSMDTRIPSEELLSIQPTARPLSPFPGTRQRACGTQVPAAQ